MDLRTLARAYDRSAAGYDERFRALQRPKYEAAARLLGGLPAGLCLDAGGGTGLFAEFAASATPRATATATPSPAASAPPSPTPAATATPAATRVIVLDVSLAMLRVARARGVACVLGDLAAPPFAPGSFPLVVSFTAVLADVPRALRALRALGDLVAPGGHLLVSFLAGESPAPDAVARHTGLALRKGPVAAGQDQLFHATR